MADEPIMRAIKELRTELSRLDQVIKSIELLVAGKPRRGRPPKFLQEAGVDGASPKKRGRPRKTAAPRNP